MGCPKATRREGVKMGREWSPGPILLILDLVTWKKGFGAKACVVWRENQAEELEILHTDNSFQKFYYKDQQRFYKWHVFTVKTWMTLRTQSRKKIPCYPTIWKKKKSQFIFGMDPSVFFLCFLLYGIGMKLLDLVIIPFIFLTHRQHCTMSLNSLWQHLMPFFFASHLFGRLLQWFYPVEVPQFIYRILFLGTEAVFGFFLIIVNYSAVSVLINKFCVDIIFPKKKFLDI